MYVKWFQVQEILLIQTEFQIFHQNSLYFIINFFPKKNYFEELPLIKFSIGKFLYNSSLKKY